MHEKYAPKVCENFETKSRDLREFSHWEIFIKGNDQGSRDGTADLGRRRTPDGQNF